ncbi:hypothetical protein [Sphaerisporangium dianthi]|uniref:Uncharacterized protein n=1 Tax=Sphaerisporangium dianthi TaxID=1436120 RepID=A0ABV9CGS4_9ACTN
MRTGRHARGRTGERRAVPRRDWEAEARAAARMLDAVEPAWSIFYGVWSRRYFAIATWRAAEPTMVGARSLGDLRRLMREAELADIARTATFVAV